MMDQKEKDAWGELLLTTARALRETLSGVQPAPPVTRAKLALQLTGALAPFEVADRDGLSALDKYTPAAIAAHKAQRSDLLVAALRFYRCAFTDIVQRGQFARGSEWDERATQLRNALIDEGVMPNELDIRKVGR